MDFWFGDLFMSQRPQGVDDAGALYLGPLLLVCPSLLGKLSHAKANI